MITYRTMLCREGEWTPDGRQIAPGALTWPRLPLPLAYQERTRYPQAAGVITQVWRRAAQRDEILAIVEAAEPIYPPVVAIDLSAMVAREVTRGWIRRRKAIVIEDARLAGATLIGSGRILDWGILEPHDG